MFICSYGFVHMFRICPCAIIAFSEIWGFLTRMQTHGEMQPWFARELWSVLVVIGEKAREKGRDVGAELRRWDAVHVKSWGLKAAKLWLFPSFLNTDGRSLPSCCHPDSHGCAFADSGEHYKLENSPEGA